MTCLQDINQKMNYFLHKIDGITHKQLVNMAPWITSSSGRTLKARRLRPTICNVSNVKTIANSSHVKLLMLLKNQSLIDLIKVPNSGTANARIIVHFHEIICSGGIKATSCFSGTNNKKTKTLTTYDKKTHVSWLTADIAVRCSSVFSDVWRHHQEWQLW